MPRSSGLGLIGPESKEVIHSRCPTWFSATNRDRPGIENRETSYDHLSC
jgi:hypothetical protein